MQCRAFPASIHRQSGAAAAMATYRLKFEHPRVWIENTPSRVWNPKTRSWIYPPKLPKHVAAAYSAYVLSAMNSHALRILNRSWELDDDTIPALTRDLRAHAIAAGRRVGVTFTPGNSTAGHVLAGQHSLKWLEHAAADVAEWAADIWDPVKAQRIHDDAVRRGKASLGLTAADLLPLDGLSISKQAAELGCSPRKVAYLRAELRQAAA
jgi:hypothetical protein